MNILNRLTIRHLKLNKKRTIVSIIGIILSTALMVGIGLLFSTLRDNAVRETIISQGSYHSMLKDVSGKYISSIQKEQGVKDLFLSEFISYATIKDSEKENSDSYVRIEAADDNYFKEITLVRGRLPQNENEVLVPVAYENDSQFQLNHPFTLSLGTFLINQEESREMCSECSSDEQVFMKGKEKSYTIVGYYGSNPYVSWSDTVVITLLKEVSENQNYNIYLHFDKMKQTDEITKKLWADFNVEEVKYNNSLLGLSGISKYDNIIQTLVKSMAILLTLVTVGCVIVIYNSFAISVLERKKHFGLFSSIGATKKQIRKTVLFEAIVVGVIGIILGILGAFLGIGIVLAIINHLLPDLLNGGPLRLCVYPIFIIVPIIFMIITILISAFIPARRASKISPIEAIRLNDDIKMPAHKLKTPSIVSHIFKEEGVIAYKNMKRNKKKYRITIISLFISIVLFLSFSSYMQLAFNGIHTFVSNPGYDSVLNLGDTSLTNQEISELRKEKSVRQSFYGTQYSLTTSSNLKEIFTEEYRKLYDENDTRYDINLIEVPKADFEIYKKDTKVTKNIPLIYNNFNRMEYQKNSRKSYSIKKFENNKSIPLKLCESRFISNETGESTTEYACEQEIKEYALLNHDFFGIEEFKENIEIVILIPEGYFGDLSEFNDGITKSIFFDLDEKNQALQDRIDTFVENGKIKENAYYDIRENVRYTRNMIFVAKLLVYGFISLISLIGITSVFNTLYTSIHLRRREFAILRSIGLTTGGFNRMLLFECFFFGMKSLLYSLPVSAVLIVIINHVMEGISDAGEIMWPVSSIIGVIFAVFFIILLTTMYATRKIKHENIMEAIREENI